MKTDRVQIGQYLLAAAAEGCWLFALLALMNGRAAGGILPVSLLLPVLPVSLAFNIYLRLLKWPQAGRLALGWLAWAPAMLIVLKLQLFDSVSWTDAAWLASLPDALGNIFHGVRPELLVASSTALLWWLGRRLAHARLTFGRALGEFQFGLAVLAALFFVDAQFEASAFNALPVGLAFFCFALAGVSMARAREGGNWFSGSYRGHWQVFLVLNLVLILVGGIVITLILTPGLLQVFVSIGSWMLGAIMNAISFLISLLPPPDPSQLPPVPLPAPTGTPEDGKWFELPEWLRTAGRWAWSISFLSLICFALWRVASQVMGWLLRKLSGLAGVQYEPLPGAFKVDLAHLLRRALRRLMSAAGSLFTRRRTVAPAPGLASVRQVYYQLLRRASGAGWPRSVSQTPDEYLATLAAALPGAEDGLSLITSKFVMARYGRLPPAEEETPRLAQAWRTLKRRRLRRPPEER